MHGKRSKVCTVPITYLLYHSYCINLAFLFSYSLICFSWEKHLFNWGLSLNKACCWLPLLIIPGILFLIWKICCFSLVYFYICNFFLCVFTLSIVLDWAVWFPTEARPVTVWTQQTCLKMGFWALGARAGKQLLLFQGVLEASNGSEYNYRNWSQTPLEFKLVQVWVPAQCHLIVWEELFSRWMFPYKVIFSISR